MNGYSENPHFAGVNYSTMPWKVPAEEPVLLRERMNRTALLIALFFPWAIFCMLIFFSFSAYDEYPMKVYFAFGCSLDVSRSSLASVSRGRVRRIGSMVS